jgi:hypothetical protein
MAGSRKGVERLLRTLDVSSVDDVPYRLDPLHRPVVITLTTALSLLAGLALGACAGSPGGTAVTQRSESYIRATTQVDGFRYVAIPGTRKILIQYSRQDLNIPDAQRDELTRSAVGTVTRKDYDAGHDLVTFGPAATDRETFLAAAL